MTDLTERDVESLVTIAHAQLAVVEAAKAETLNLQALDRIKTTGKVYAAALHKWQESLLVTEEAVDALLALEASNGNA